MFSVMFRLESTFLKEHLSRCKHCSVNFSTPEEVAIHNATLIQTNVWQQFAPLNTNYRVNWENSEDFLQYFDSAIEVFNLLLLLII